MSRWPFTKLGSLAEFKNGLNFSSANWGRGLKVIGVTDFQDYFYPKYDEVEEINPNGVVREADYLEDGDILFVRSNGNRDLIGRSLFIKRLPERMSHSGFTIRLRFKSEQVFPLYYVYLFKSSLIRTVLSVYGGGTNINNLNQQILSSLDVPLPPLATQQKIAAILSAYEELIENNRRRIALLEKLAEEIYREWFVRLRFPGHETTKKVKGVPVGWQVQELKEVSAEVGRSARPGAHLSGRFYLPLDLLSTKQMLPAGHADYTEAQSSLVTFEKNDFLFGAMRPYQHKVAIAPFPGITRTTCFVIRPKIENAWSWLFLTLFQSSSVDYASLISNGSDRPYAVWNKGMERMKLLRPGPELLSKFESMARPMLDSIVGMYFVQQKLNACRDKLLPRLISGKLALDDLAIQFPPGMAEEMKGVPANA